MNITELVESSRWKRIMGYVYGWGAAIVLLGALFKIQHWPHAGELLTLGMLTEVIIFFFSAFEPPHKETDWSLVYPELIGLDPKENRGGNTVGADIKIEGLTELQSFFENVNVDSSKLTNLSQGLAKMSEAAERISDMSEAASVTEGYIANLKKASESVNTLSDSYNSSAQHISESATQLSQSYNQMATSVSDNGKNYTDSVSTLNEKLSSLNSVFELQLKHANEQVVEGKRVQENFNEIVENLNVTLDNTKVYRQETAALNDRLHTLNSVYGNMLSALDISKDKK